MSVPMPIWSTVRRKLISTSLMRCRRTDRGAPADGRRCKAGVAEKLLDRAQIAPGAEKMGGKTVPQGMRRHGFRQPQMTTQGCHLPLHEPRVQRAATSAD